MLKTRRIKFDIGPASIIWVIIAFVGFRFVVNIMDIIFLIFSAILITLAVCPLVDWLQKYRINRAFSAIAILLSIFSLVIYATTTLATPLFTQTELFLQRLPALVTNILPYNVDIGSFTSQLSFVPGQVLKIALGTVSGLLTAFTVIVISYYMILELHNLPRYFEFWFGKEKGERYYFISKKLEEQIGNWVRGELFLMLIVGVLSYIGYLIIGLPFTVALGVISGLLELIPNIGPTIAAVPAILVGLSISPSHGLAAMIVAIVVQQLENNIIVPKVMQKAAGISPVISITALMIGLKLGGPILAILSLPLVLCLRVIVGHIRVNKHTNIPEIH